jgi:hypothetical protein
MGEAADGDQAALRLLEAVFADQPDLLDIVTAGDLESQQLLAELRKRDNLLAGPVQLYVVGRTGAGKTSIGNRLFGADVMKSTGHMNCTDFIGVLRLRSNLHYVDTPGAGSDEAYENWARLALGLPQLDEDPAERLGVHDFTNARLTVAGDVEDVAVSEFTPAEWAAELAGPFAPDVVVYVVAPHMQFLRTDREFLAAMLKRHGAKLVIAFNDWDGTTTDIHRGDAAKAIRGVYARLFPGGSPQPVFARVNALAGTGMSELTAQICRVIAPEKLGSMRQVLESDLKKSAQRVRSSRYRDTVNRIAARLALHTVDQKLGDQDLISAAAAGVSRYGVLTFEAEDLGAALDEELGDLLENSAQVVRQERQEEIKVKEAQTAKKDLTEKVPVIEEEEITTSRRTQVATQVREATGTGFFKKVGAWMDAGAEHVEAAWNGAGDAEHAEITKRRREKTANYTTRTEMQDVEIPVTQIRQKVTGYTTKVIGTVEEVVGTTERVVGTRALRGGAPVIELLVAVGLGVEAYCTATGQRPGAETFIDNERAKVHLVLDRATPEIDAFLQQGSAAEPDLIELLGRVL